MCQFDCNLSLCSLLNRLSRPGMLSTCKLSIKQTFCDWTDRWQPDKESHLYQFLLSGCQLELASNSWWYCTSQTAVWSGILCVILVFFCDICILSLSSWSVELIPGMVCCLSVSDPALNGYFLLLLRLILRLSSLNWASSRRVGILSLYHHHHRFRTFCFHAVKLNQSTYFYASGHHPLSMLLYLGCTWSGVTGCTVLVTRVLVLVLVLWVLDISLRTTKCL